MEKFLMVGLGGALGAICRYSISLVPLRVDFPFLTLFTNVLGAILVGFIVGLATYGDSFSEGKLLFWKVGVCGGFTTFSTFSLEALQLFDNGKLIQGSAYVMLSFSLCLVGVIIGQYASKMLLKA